MPDCFIFYLLRSVLSVDRSFSWFIYFSHIENLRIPESVGFGHRGLYPLPYKHSLKRVGWFPNRSRDSWWLFRWKFCQNWLNLIFTDDSGQRIIFDILRLEDDVRRIGTDKTVEIVDLTNASSLDPDGYQKITGQEWMKEECFANGYLDLIL